MGHLTDGQLEAILADEAEAPAHLATCRPCGVRLRDHRAVRSRLRAAFEAVRASRALREEVVRATRAAGRQTSPAAIFLARMRRVLRVRFPALAAVAALLVVGLLGLLLATPSRLLAAEEELAAIHRHNLTGHGEYFAEEDPEKLAAFFRDRLGFSPILPRRTAGLAVRGCCVRHFRGKIVGSYVVQTPHGPMSIIAIAPLPKQIGAGRTLRLHGRAYAAGSFEQCNIVAARVGTYTYCAVGETRPELLADVLDRLVHPSGPAR